MNCRFVGGFKLCQNNVLSLYLYAYKLGIAGTDRPSYRERSTVLNGATGLLVQDAVYSSNT